MRDEAQCVDLILAVIYLLLRSKERVFQSGSTPRIDHCTVVFYLIKR